VSVDITYEPSKVGDVRSFLQVSSPFGGDYICPLIGHCVPPKPQGPILIKVGANSASVFFRNLFTQNTTFNFSVDNNAFNVKSTEVIPSKKTVPITINYKGGSKKTGKLSISHSCGYVWVYYLKGG
jgi:hydrocephalus-inducing protein